MSVSEANPDRPLFNWYIENYHRSNTQGTVEQARNAEQIFERFLQEKELNPESVGEDVAIEFIKFVADNYSAHYQSKIIGDVKNFYAYCLSKGVDGFEGNPFESVLMEHDFLDPIREKEPHILPVGEMSDYIISIDNPRYHVPVLTMAKTTRRIGEVINLDLIDVNIAHPACDWDVHQKIRHKEDYLYFGPEPEKGKEFRGEIRHCSNKTEAKRVVPIDDELKAGILWYLSIRPGSNDPFSPLFKSAGTSTKRLHRGTLGDKITQYSKQAGHYYGPDDEDKLSSHYLRHWSTTTIRDRTVGDSGLVDYIRGDSGNIKDRYTHWSDSKEKEYLDVVPKFFD
jgi:integrase